MKYSTMHKATVYILVYNNEHTLKDTVDSVLKQDMDDIQVIISDDGSTKYDTSLLEKYGEMLRTRFEDVIINVNECNIGTVKHINKVFSLCTGQYLFPLSSGDIFYNSSVVRRYVDAMDKKHSLILTSRHKDVYDDGHSKIRPQYFVGMALRLCPKKLTNYMIRKRNLLSGCSTVYSRELLERHGCFDEKYHLVEDYPYYISLLRKGVRFDWIAGPEVIHGIGGVSTGRVHPSIYKDIELMREELYESIDEFDKKTQAYLKTCHEEN